MKINGSHSFTTGSKGETSLYSKVVLLAIMIALLLASFPVSSALAAPSGDDQIDILEQVWSNKVSIVRAENLFYAQVKLFPADYKKSADMARPYELISKYSVALKQANDIILKHAGFDKTGDVIDVEDALQSTYDLSTCILIMNGMKAKLEEEGYPFHRIK